MATRWAGLAGAWALAQVAGAAPLHDPASLRQAQDPAGLAAPGGTPSRVLDRALSVDAHLGQRNLEVLVEPGGAAGAVPPPVARRPAAPLSGQAQAAAPGQLAAPSYLPAHDTVPTLSRDRTEQQALPAGTAAMGDGRLARDLPMADRMLDPAERREALNWLRQPAVQAVVDVLRTYRYWLLGALAALLGVVAVVQASGRRLAATPEERAAAAAKRRADDLASLGDASRSRHRSAHRSASSGEHRARRRSSRRD